MAPASCASASSSIARTSWSRADADRSRGGRPAGFDALVAEDFAAIAALAPEVALLGTGSALRFPHPRLTRALVDARIGLEVMDTAAACRTFNILAAEGRRVAAAVFVGD